MDTIKVDLPGGNWADFFVEMKHKTQRAVEERTREYLTYPEGVGKLKLSQGEDGETVQVKAAVGEVEVTVDLDRIDWIAVSELIILNQVASWSFGEVTVEVLGEQSEAVYEILKAKVNELYQSNSPFLAGSGAVNSAKGWRLLSRFRHVFVFRRN